MEKVVFFCMFWIMQISSDVSRDEVTLLRVQMGENISLSCNMTNRYEIAWFHQHSQQITQIINAKISNASGKRLLVTYNRNQGHVRLTADSQISSVSLLISELSESDLGLYFCGTKSVTSELNFHKPFRLQTHDKLVDKDHLVTKSPKDVESPDEVTLTERVLMFGGVALAISVFFLTTFIAGGIIHHHGWQKGWSAAKRSSLRSHKSLK